ncbi:MAG TPA: DUF5606 domain-containing protein [Ferruginibacter sp.]|nr:DUF5606 domain-containing protein [Ferruginibacter sp.]HMP19832.1 DUF5606 domain-containing protein [Ferruginibacter sp.]
MSGAKVKHSIAIQRPCFEAVFYNNSFVNISLYCGLKLKEMEYSKLVAVTGLPGLFELVSSKADGGIVRSLEDKTAKFVSSRVHSFSHLESIEVYTTRDNINLVDVFKAMEASTEALPDAKADAKDIKAYFTKVVPDMDFERVYNSDMKKMVKWFTLIKANDIEIKLSELPAGEDAAAEHTAPKIKAADTKPAAAKAAPVKRVNAPRKMA